MIIRPLRAAALSALLLSAACATAPATESAPAPRAEAAPLNAAGTYTFTLETRGQRIDGTVRLARAGEGYAGTVSVPAIGDMPVRAVSVQGNRVRVTAQGRMGDAVLTLNVNGDRFAGDWTYGPSSGELAGRVQPAA